MYNNISYYKAKMGAKSFLQKRRDIIGKWSVAQITYYMDDDILKTYLFNMH